MPRPKTPLKVIRTKGLDKRDPGRYGGRSEPRTRALGEPSASLDAAAREAWKLFTDEIPWLAESDRALVEIACTLRARLMTDPEMGVNALAQLRMCLSAMGASPADRSKVGAQDEPEDDPADKFLN